MEIDNELESIIKIEPEKFQSDKIASVDSIEKIRLTYVQVYE